MSFYVQKIYRFFSTFSAVFCLFVYENRCWSIIINSKPFCHIHSSQHFGLLFFCCPSLLCFHRKSVKINRKCTGEKSFDAHLDAIYETSQNWCSTKEDSMHRCRLQHIIPGSRVRQTIL